MAVSPGSAMFTQCEEIIWPSGAGGGRRAVAGPNPPGPDPREKAESKGQRKPPEPKPPNRRGDPGRHGGKGPEGTATPPQSPGPDEAAPTCTRSHRPRPETEHGHPVPPTP
ncbi:collagen alpha-4(IV) chain-like [Penaeus chinensis]|uniref:collagen alpha-4(IV) chain-like n=1 Tax=Penaeus chinensis TaxID=139456 RepID=UPI001FB700A6|nr:collagen alpha-4(IV) chain-like [Penaeus chinensis]